MCELIQLEQHHGCAMASPYYSQRLPRCTGRPIHVVATSTTPDAEDGSRCVGLDDRSPAQDAVEGGYLQPSDTGSNMSSI
jgi:hypothetical protein